ncbi:hypothetical protein MMC07_002012 [Pseudocyphellaria aurata]|nr:hypothetical protein [Pseudocyphellaria aurata]
MSPTMPQKSHVSNSPGQVQILSRPQSSDGPFAINPSDLSEFMFQPDSTMVPSLSSPHATPTTPSRSTSTQSRPPHGQHQSANSILDNKLRRTNMSGNTQPVKSPLVARDQSDTRRAKSQTPSRGGATPSQRYAGPLFHASPDPSALPIPKWFSKTIIERKQTSNEIGPETEAMIVSPDQSDESPTLRKCPMGAKQLADEHPPKFNMPASWSEKGIGNEGNAIPGSGDGESFISPSLSTSTLVNSSASPEADGPQYPRHRTSQSSKELFPFETEYSTHSSVPKQGGDLQRNFTEWVRPKTAPSDIGAEIEDDEKHRKEMSLALKKLLQGPSPPPIPPRPVSASLQSPATASDNLSRTLRPAREPLGISAPVSFPAFSSKPFQSPPQPYLPRTCSHDSIHPLVEAPQHSNEAPQLSAPYYNIDSYDKPNTTSNLHGFRTPYTSTEQRPLTYGQRALLMEDYLRRGKSFKCSPCTSSSQVAQDLDNAFLTTEDHARLSEDYIQRRGGTCSCKSVTNSDQSSSSVESTSPKDVDQTKRMKDYLRREVTFQCRPVITSPQSFPGVDNTSLQDDPKKWLDNHLRHDILKIGTFGNDCATGVAT